MSIKNLKISEVVRRSIKMYFLPITSIFGGNVFLNADGQFFSRKQIEFRLSITNWVKDVICYNQSAIIEFGQQSSDLHKALRVRFDNPKPDKEEIELAREELVDYINDGFFKALSNNFAFLSEYFLQQSDQEGPRICVKGNFRTVDKDVVVTIFRDRKVGYKNDTKLEENSGFDHCRKTGNFYLNNDIVSSVARNEYKNSRLDYSRIKSANVKARKKEIWLSENWSSLWTGSKESEDSAYKATLIVPITLWNNDLSVDFLKKIDAVDTDRLIFGYLCFDHPEKNYFNCDADVDIAYIVADLLSVYAFDRLRYSDYSSSFKGIERYLGKSLEEKFSKHLADKHSEFLSDFNSADGVNSTRNNSRTSIKNKLVEMDEVLVKITGNT